MTNIDNRKRGFLSGYFVVAAVILVAAAIGLPPGIKGLEHAYSKEPIELRKKLDEFDIDKMPSWRLATEGVWMQLAEGDVETDDVTHAIVEPDVADPSQHEQTMLFITYYSDPRDRISHTPEVCYRQSGAVIESLSSLTVDSPALGPDGQDFEARLLDIDQLGRRTALLYVFYCNGKFYTDREKVRFAIGWPGDKRIYFSKVEAVTVCPSEDGYDAAVERCRSLLSEALPILIEEHYPRDEDVRR